MSHRHDKKEKKSKKHSHDKPYKSSKSSSSSASKSDDNFDLSAVTRQISKEIEAVVKAEPIPVVDLDTVEGTPDDGGVGGESVVKGNFYVYAKKCLNCVHLCPTIGKKSYSDCHYTHGNDSCPAQEIKVVVMLPYETISNRLFEAHIKGDAATLASLMARLNRQDQDEVDKVLARYAKLLEEHHSN